MLVSFNVKKFPCCNFPTLPSSLLKWPDFNFNYPRVRVIYNENSASFSASFSPIPKDPLFRELNGIDNSLS